MSSWVCLLSIIWGCIFREGKLQDKERTLISAHISPFHRRLHQNISPVHFIVCKAFTRTVLPLGQVALATFDKDYVYLLLGASEMIATYVTPFPCDFYVI